MRYAFLWIFMVLLVGIILTSTLLPGWFAVITISLALIADMFAVRISLIELRIKLSQQGLELGQLFPSTLIIFGWLIYAVVHFQIFLAIVHYLDLAPASLKWVFPLTAFKALWPVYYLGSKLPEKKQLNYSVHSIAFHLPWAIGGAIIWCISNSTEGNVLLKLAWAATIVLIAISPGFLYFKAAGD